MKNLIGMINQGYARTHAHTLTHTQHMHSLELVGPIADYFPLRMPIPVNVKPVLNWANVCLPNILQTLPRTTIRFLIELLMCRTCFGQSKLYFILKWLVMRYKLWPKLAADAQQTA